MKNNRTLLFSCLALAIVASAEPNRRWPEDGLQIRGIFDPPGTSLPDTASTSATDTGTPDTNTDTTTTAETTTADTTTADTTTTTPTTKPNDPATTSATTPATSKTDTTTSPTTKNTDDNNTGTSTTPPTTQAPSTSHVVTTNDNGDAITIYTTYTPTPTVGSSSAASASSSGDASNTDNEDKGISTGSIIGMSVAGGVALIGFACFIFWKFTRKRAADFDDNEAIKWPELNSHAGDVDSQPLPTGTGRFDDGSNLSLSRQNSGGTTGGRSYAGASNYSTAELAHDPYGVPPLPHLNPNQSMPYRDDPAAAAYYDPYRGPVPQFGPLPGEAIPMGQMQYSDMAYGDPRVASPMRTGSPAPLGAPQAYGLGASDQIARTGSPMRMASPGPGSAYGPGPQAAYDPVTFHGGR